MIDHVTVPVTSRKVLDLYLKALAPIGWGLCMELTRERIPQLNSPWMAGLGPHGRPYLWLREDPAPVTPIHFALRSDRAGVDAFHRAALAAGLRDNGAPGPRPHYTPDYYGAFVLDPDGHNFEVVARDEG